mgnify:CR=1 FL=1
MRKKKVITKVMAMLLSFAVVFSMIPGVVFADTVSKPTVIKTADEFANMKAGGSYKLGEDIIVEAPYKRLFKGTFDGDGHTVTLNLNVTSGNAGLFAETGSGANISNVIVAADVSSSVGYYGTGGLIGKVSGSTTVNSCGVTGAVKNTYSASNYGTYVGGLVGLIAGNCTVNNSFSSCDVSNSGASVLGSTGGLIGKTSNYSLDISNCYSLGSVTGNKGYAGGLTGYVYCSASCKHNYSNCYAAGKVTLTRATSNACGFAYSYASTGFTFTNCYYNNTTNSKGFNKTLSGIIEKSSDELKTLAGTLGDAYRSDTQGINNGYPILSWQYVDPNAKSTVTFNITPADSVLTWNDKEQLVSETGAYTFTNVGVGEYSYKVANEKGDYTEQTGTVSVKGKDVTKNINLEQNKHKLSFDITPAGAKLAVKDSGDKEITADADGGYYVINGTYRYSLTAFGYKNKDGTVTVDRSDKKEKVEMDKQPDVTVTFRYADHNVAITGGRVVVKTGDREISAEDGSDGLVYKLPAGYEYMYTFTSGNYAKQEGTLDYKEVTEAKAEIVDISMTEKTVWEGGSDITEPASVDGIYQISSGSELAWLAQQVNSDKNSDCSAVLTKDIDLGNESWTPVGKSNYYAFKGTFDGQGHSVNNISINNSSSDQGLFGYINGAIIKNLTVKGSITGGNNTGGITGTFAGAATIENCENYATVNGANNVGGIAGNISTTTAKTINQCANFGKISGNNNVGGIVGYVYYKCLVSNSYNRGSVNASVSKAGGLVGYMKDSGAVLINCYTTGTVSGEQNFAPVVGNKSIGTVTNCYYLDTIGTDSNATFKTDDDLKNLAGTLGDSFVTAPAELNDGYPVLAFQIPRYDAVFTVNDENATVEIEGYTGVKNANVWSFRLADGSYSYRAYSFGKVEQRGTVTVQGGNVNTEIELQKAKTKPVKFTVKPDNINAVIKVMWNGQEIAAVFDGSCILPYGNYSYTIKARGYAGVTGTLKVDENSENVTVTMTESSAWDGEAKDAPSGEGTAESPYLIEDGAQLAWFADKVNGASSSYYAELVNDIDLGEKSWTPIGKDLYEFQGSFDGRGNTVSGLNVSGAYSGLFGFIKDAEIKNLTVKGQVAGTEYAAGIAAKAKGTSNTISACGNEADISGKNAAGILGWNGIYNTNCTIIRCYNTGAVASTVSTDDRAGGIVAYNTGKTTVSESYNTGDITSNGYAGGIFSGTGISVSGSYNSGIISGADSSKTGAITTGKSDSITKSYYLKGTANDRSGNAVELTAMELQALDMGEAFEHVAGINRDFPVLKWQNLKPLKGDAVLADDAEFGLEKVYVPDNEEAEDGYLATPELKWKAVDGAESYVITLWRTAAYEKAGDINDIWNFIYWEDEEAAKYLTDEQFKEYSSLKDTLTTDGKVTHPKAEYLQQVFKDKGLEVPSHGEIRTEFVTAVYDVKGTSYDCSNVFESLPEGVYYAAVVPMNSDGTYIIPSMYKVEAEVIGFQNPYDRMKPVTDLEWDGTRAKWSAKDNFTANQIYTVKLYTVEDGKYTFFKSFEISGVYNAADFGNVFAAETDYAFTVTAHSDEDYIVKYGLTDSPESAMSPVYKAGEATDPTEDHTGWTAISTAKQWIDLANIEDEPSDPDNSASESRQAVEWRKNYYLTADLDFSELSAADQAKTKSIGNVTNRFMGTFDGNGFKIKGLNLSNSDSGLFWYIGSTGYIYDLTVENANVLFSDNAAVVAHMNYGKIEKCGVVNTNITADTGAVLGAMVSRNYGIVRDSYVQGGSLVSNSTTATGHAGFAGSNESGGLIERCWTSMDINTASDYSGGFVGLGYGGTIRDCFALGNVKARGYSGGFIGRSVYSGNVYANCYAAGTVTVTGDEGHGFIGGNKPDSAFQTDQSKGISNCYYNSASPEDKNGAIGKSVSEMKSDEFLSALNKNASWTRSDENNDGLPYLSGVAIPQKQTTSTISVQVLIAEYDKNSYDFSKMGDVIDVTVESTGNTRVVDVMDAAAAQNNLTYSYNTTAEYGRFIHTINGRAVESPDGWMFTVNDKLSNVSASLAAVKDNDKILWYEGTTQNLFKGPSWEYMTGENPDPDTTVITETQQLVELSNASGEALTKSYKLGADIDLTGIDFNGIGNASEPFSGSFDGNGFKISNMTIKKDASSEGVGLFNYIMGAAVKNVKLENADVTGGSMVGGIAGWAVARVSTENMAESIGNLIGNCHVSGKVKSLATGSKGAYAGGLVGDNDGETDSKTGFSVYSSIDKCSADVSVEAEGAYAGGLVGGNFGNITDSYATGDVSGKTGTGGFAGTNAGSIYSSHSEGSVSGTGSIGGFAGTTSGEIRNSYSLGTVNSLSAGDKIGGFIGNGSGTVKDCMSAGVLSRSTGDSYVGGFAGFYTGKLAGLAKDIQLSGCYGNCTTAQNETVSAIGNMTSSTIEAEKKVLSEMQLTDNTAVADKLFEMFGVRLNGYTINELEDILGKINENISAGFKNGENAPWEIADMISYADAYGQSAGLSDKQIQAYINYVAEKGYTATSAGDLAKYIISLKALGYDATKIVTVNQASGTYFDMVAKLKNMLKDGTGGSGSIYTLPYILIALQQDAAYATNDEINDIVNSMLDQQLKNGGWGYTYSGTEYEDIDADAFVILALSKYYDTNSDVKNAVDKALNKENINRFQGESGAIYSSWSNAPSAESTGMLLAAIASAGENADEYKFKNKTLTDGLMAMYNADEKGFTFEGKVNSLSTEQGFRGLMSYVRNTYEAGYNIFDFSSKPSNIAKATGSAEEGKPSDPSGTTDITAYLTIKTDSEVWLNHSTVSVKEGSTVYHILTNGLPANMSQEGAASGYVKSITKDGVTLAEFDKGENSGWLYTVNGTMPNVPLTSYTVANGDEILWYYTTDYTKDPNAGNWDENKDEVITTGNAGSATTTAPAEVKVSGNTATATVTDENAAELIKQAKENRSVEIVINVSSSDTKDAETVNLELDKKTVESIVKDTEATVTVKTPAGEINLDKETLKQIAGEAEGNKISIEITKLSKPEEAQKSLVGANGQIFKLAVKSGNKVISKFKGTVTVRLAVPAALKDKNIAAVHIEGSALEKLEGRRITQNKVEFYEFKTPHFSEFALVDTAEVKVDGDDNAESIDKTKSLIKELKLKAVSSKTAKKNVKVTVKMNSKNNTLIKELSDMGYTVKYRYYRSVKKASKYTAVKTKTSKTYINTKGKRGSKYYYKVRAVVYDGDKVIAQSALKQCKYAVRTWSK